MPTDNVVDFNEESPRAVLTKLLKMVDEGKVDSIVAVGQGYDEANKRKILVPMAVGVTLGEICIADAIVNEMRGEALAGVLRGSEKIDA